jgi:20S proteasome subunit beta 1
MIEKTLPCCMSLRIVSILLLLCAVTAAPEEVSMGTTLVALKYQNGVVVAADTRTSVSGYVSNKFAKKIDIVVNEPETSCVICRSGSAADTQWLAQHASHEFAIRRSLPSVSQVAHYLRDKMRSESSLQASLICAGYDGTGRLFGIAPGGSLWEEDVFCVSGSGSTFLMGHLDSLKLKSTSITEDQAVELVTQLVRLSIARDGSSGGLIRIMVLTQGGVKEITVYPEVETSRDLPGFAKATYSR